MPVNGLWLTPFQANSQTVVLPMTMAPAFFSRLTKGASVSGTKPFCVTDPRSLVTPLT